MTFSITVKTRQDKADKTREQGLVPGILYGPETKPVPFSVGSLAFEKLYEQTGESNLIDLTLDSGEPVKVLVQDIQKHPVKDNIMHIDLLQINMSKEMFATLPITFVGESLAVKALGGTLNKGLDEVEIKCLPKDLVGHIEVDLSVLATFDDFVRVKDLVLPPGITVLDNQEVVVAKVSAPLTEEQIKAMEESGSADIASVVVEGEKKEDATASEGGEEKKEEKKKE
ncbi:MAG: hypothetical protein A2725_02270 [Candidatus Magasanikbacteria bacterium RIFCSPHIGHO2_01_FULL_33_34]|uniref:Large ribosomal subunit protein bL25 n=1 Tax=Candidatus Magasanikbacteria bacterium RIFCSPHIGHO2_01_FULL_33_34 TaxID=1798671 RepID=A0A1F6LK91_9BACT|nr:MAG: hypothetical protein A2725_02270 [Candidatus Magasanikbacteria bacterium RIFCSPHIGHO2_01_FULL_33_34]OGH65651.1 MAG: hypothetical protein A3B83_02130 [Candidatus Magasanikbacteria bacterium RIFCSPHIGHO2_02_FULL_33_17]OGH75860.1 MAG: hypothetical protein A3A89_03025 [Candidatus Magasanikbacteria bacterium RIFCSPLOWO2_01_FULL_33_34]OGH81842.1 MAG: hypothetical protein A3F93_00255 [Candidatus Magasanikbacteria bacterium RIFCSPLOWO2_12_FULL_34_7]